MTWLTQHLHTVLLHIQHLQKQVPNVDHAEDQHNLRLFHKRVHASLLFENINSIAATKMSDQPRRFNCALLCALHDLVENYSLYDMKLYLLSKQKSNSAAERTAKRFCFATIAFRIATGTSGKINNTTRCIKDLLYSNAQHYRYATTFLNFFSSSFHPSYNIAFSDLRHGLESHDLYKTKQNLMSKNKSALYTDETPHQRAMHYNHFLLYDNLSSSFQRAFLHNAFNLQSYPTNCKDSSHENQFPFLAPEQQSEMLHRSNQIWHVFGTDW